MSRIQKVVLIVLLIFLGVIGCDEQGSKYEFHFDSNGGSLVSGYWIRRVDWDGILPTPFREGYVFDGWYMDPELTKEATKEAVIENGRYSVDLYAKWLDADIDVPQEFWVTDFDGSFILHSTTTVGGTIGEVAHAVPFADYGFYEIETHPDRVASVLVLTEGTPTLKLFYQRKSVSITYYPWPGMDPISITGLAYAPLELFTEGTQHANHVFEGWYHMSIDVGKKFDMTTFPPYDLSVSARYVFQTVSVTFVMNEEETLEPIVGYPFETLPLPSVEREGYTFLGWYIDAECTIPYDPIILDANSSSWGFPAENTTMYAKWSGNDSTVYVFHWFENNDGTYSHKLTTEQIGQYGRRIYALSLPNDDLYEFTNMHPNQVLSGRPEVGQTLILHAYYERVAYQLTFDYGFNGESTVVSVKHGEKFYQNLPLVERLGYHFQGLKYQTDSLAWITSSHTMPPRDLTVFLIWAPGWHYLLFDVYGDGVLRKHSVLYGTTVELYPVNMTGYDFVGWFYDEERTNPCPWTIPAPPEDLILYAKWSPKVVIVTFETNGAGAIEPIQVLYGSSYALPTPEQEGFIFGGWYRDPELTVKHIHTPEMSDLGLTLYAKWLNMTYMIHFDTMGGRYVQDQNLPPGSPLELPIPTRTGFDFIGWFDASLTIPFTETLMPEHNLVLYAKWQLKQ